MERKLQDAVRRRARLRCEYCRLPSALSDLPFQVDHVIARKHGGLTTLENLAFACLYCNSYKGPNLSGVDPISRQIVRLFNPRQDGWDQHFRWNGAILTGRTSIARATIEVLRINHPDAVEVRSSMMVEGVFP